VEAWHPLPIHNLHPYIDISLAIVEAFMNTAEFLSQLDARIAKYDLLCHPFYKAWSAGELTHDDLREYAEDYYHHVDAFPSYLAAFAMRLEDGEVRRAVLANMADEKGTPDGVEHSELWLDFAEGIGSSRNLQSHKPVSEVRELIDQFGNVARDGSTEEALAAFYAYESQVPRVAKEKERGLREMYKADNKTCGYFTLHATADVYHSRIWRKLLEKLVAANPETAEKALEAAENAAHLLWCGLAGIESRRMAKAAA
jgi:pyrroloquinoline-quinone synthase